MDTHDNMEEQNQTLTQDASPLNGEAAVEAEQAAEQAPALSHAELKSALESVIFAANEPVPTRRLARLVGSTIDAIAPVLEELRQEYETRGIHLQEVAGGFQFRSSPQNAAWVQRLVAPKPLRLTRAQLETIAIVAYRQPITRPEVEDVRGVDCGSALQMLGERGLIKILGRKDEPGRPLLYGTTPEFLVFFGLNSLRDLPTLREYSELSEQHRTLFAQELGDMELDRANEEARGATQHALDELQALEAQQSEQAEAQAQDSVSEIPAESVNGIESVEVDEVAWVKEAAS